MPYTSIGTCKTFYTTKGRARLQTAAPVTHAAEVFSSHAFQQAAASLGYAEEALPGSVAAWEVRIAQLNDAGWEDVRVRERPAPTQVMDEPSGHVLNPC
jgi:hypothetical protein